MSLYHWLRDCNASSAWQVLPSIFSSKPRDFSLPNSSWGKEMMQLYEHYNSQCEAKTDGEEDQGGQWTRLPSYNRSLKYATGTRTVVDKYLSAVMWNLYDVWTLSHSNHIMEHKQHF